MNLAQALNDEHMRLEAAECIRELIEEIRLVPDNGKLRVELYGELAARAPPLQGNGGANNAGCGGRICSRTYHEGAKEGCLRLVAGARNQRCLHLDHAIL
jgi:hypothetical protein